MCDSTNLQGERNAAFTPSNNGVRGKVILFKMIITFAYDFAAPWAYKLIFCFSFSFGEDDVFRSANKSKGGDDGRWDKRDHAWPEYAIRRQKITYDEARRNTDSSPGMPALIYLSLITADENRLSVLGTSCAPKTILGTCNNSVPWTVVTLPFRYYNLERIVPFPPLLHIRIRPITYKDCDAV